MAQVELKTIPTNQIVANPEQPRETFERDKLRELAESILGNGLINPITVRKKGNQFEIVAGERRWKAHQIAKTKNIPAIVKKYKNDFRAMIESSIENYQREDITSSEKEKDIFNVWEKGIDVGEIKTYKDLGKIMGLDYSNIQRIIEAKEAREKLNLRRAVSTRDISDTASLDDEDRKKILKKNLQTEKLRETVRLVKKAPEEVKDALLDDKITIDQAERISKLNTEREREIAIKQHEDISRVEKSVERVIEQQVSTSEKRRMDKQLVQSKNWIASFKGKVVDTRKEIEKTLKILMISTKFIPMMDDTQKEKLKETLDRFIEVLDKGRQLSEQIQERL